MVEKLYSDLILFLIAVLNTFTALIMWITHRKHAKMEADVQKIELATNSMKDALVKATGDAARAEGRAEGRQSQKDETKDKN